MCAYSSTDRAAVYETADQGSNPCLHANPFNHMNEIIDRWTTPDYRLQHVLSSSKEVIEFVRAGSQYVCANKHCNLHCETVFDEGLNRRRYSGGFRMELEKPIITQFNISKYCKCCDTLLLELEKSKQ